MESGAPPVSGAPPAVFRAVPSSASGRFPVDTDKNLQRLIRPHIDSFNYMLDGGLASAVADIAPREVRLGAEATAPLMRFWVENAELGHPMKSDASADPRLSPAECRERGLTYGGAMNAVICRRINDGPVERVPRKLGAVAVMVRSARCYTAGLSPEELVRRHEEPSGLGGYFIVNGKERLLRMLQIPRRNHPLAVTRAAFSKRGKAYSNKGVMMRCVRPDQSGVTVTLHYLLDGSAMLRFSVKKQEFFIPASLALRSLVETTDRELFSRVLRGDTANTYLSDRVQVLLSDKHGVASGAVGDVRAFLGSRFRAVLDMPASLTDAEAGALLLRRYVLVHLTSDAAKLEVLCLMLRKLYLFAQGAVVEDNSDSLNNQELLLPGHFIQVFLKEKLEELLVGTEAQIRRDIAAPKGKNNKVSSDLSYFTRVLDKQPDIGRKMTYLLATGNLVSTSGLDMMQVSGYTVTADNINFLRFLTHFRSVHRGQFFTEMKTTTVRKLLPESWGFVCPVHTPDGAPCGLLNHLAALCEVVAAPPRLPDLPALLVELGVTPTGGAVAPSSHLPVLVDGRVIGAAPMAVLQRVATAMSRLKVAPREDGDDGFATVEVALIPPADWGLAPAGGGAAAVAGGGAAAAVAGGNADIAGTFPGMFVFTQPARPIRPVRQLESGAVEMIGPMQQVYMSIACMPEDVRAGDTTHIEISPLSMLSVAASMTPFSELNQSPRNMYQCQMAKQTLGTPCHSYTHRVDTKMYRIQTPQAPVVQTAAQAHYGMDEYPAGTNAVVAVIAYTGFDMEDAMIINKSSYERGFAHASVYKTLVADLAKDGEVGRFKFENPIASGRGRGRGGAAAGEREAPNLDADGLPPIGLRVVEGDPLYCVHDTITGKTRIVRHKDAEPAVVDEVRLLGSDARAVDLQTVSIKMRYNRNPVVGDKFSSRHGQKGVLSFLWPQADMPFSESGMSPDVIINPHAFPSRMTIGMLVESMAGKAGALHGRFQNATPFQFNEQQRAIDYFGQQLRAAGYHYCGSEPLYSGTLGTELHADIFMGVVYYQRLRHMVLDKAQVRATGPVNPLTRQPVKGRKHHGGIRFGEMERDSLIAHGAAFMLHDRTMNSSDRHTAVVCARCGSMLSPMTVRPAVAASARGDAPGAAGMGLSDRQLWCRSCDTGKHCKLVALPFVFRYLANELAAMNIQLTLTVE